MPKFWVTVVDNKTISYLIQADDAAHAQAIAEECNGLEWNDDIVEDHEEVFSEWYVDSIDEVKEEK